MIVKCTKSLLSTDDPGCPIWYPDLMVGQEYVVLAIEYDHYRLVGDEGRPYIYPSELFELVDETTPDDWVRELDDTGVCFGPRELLQPGLFEDYFNKEPRAVQIVEKHLRRT